jgi:peptide/nickel transport system permease protein
LETHEYVNGLVALVLLGIVPLVWFLRRNRFWREGLAQVYRRRRFAVVVLLAIAAIGLADSVAWLDAAAPAGETTSFRAPRTLIDRLFPSDFGERSYSAPFSDREFYAEGTLRYPGRHVLGTDILGRDVLHLTLKGAKVALLIGGLTSAIAICGISAGYYGHRIDDVVVFVINTLASIPGILLLIVLIVALGRGPLQVCVALAITGWTGLCRLVRGETLKLRELEFVQAARALGVSEFRILTRHILPNLMHLVVITFVLMFSGFVLSEAVLSYLGVGIDGSWGQMIDQARDELSREPVIWWNLAGASMALFALVLCVNLVGDAVRDVLDPRTARESS